jgi:hypothetical protein
VMPGLGRTVAVRDCSVHFLYTRFTILGPVPLFQARRGDRTPGDDVEALGRLRHHGRLAGVSGPEHPAAAGRRRAPSHYRFVLPLIHSIPDLRR